MNKTIGIKSNIEPRLWDQVKEKFADLEDSEIIEKVINEYIKLIKEEGEEGSLVTELDEQKKLTESLRKKCKNFASRVKELEDIQADQDGTIGKLKKEIKKISKDFPEFGDRGKVKEKIVYREDTKTIKELKDKRDALQKTIWEKNAELDKSEKFMTELKQNLENVEGEKGKIYAILVRLVLNKDTSKYDFVFENISRGEFNKLMRSKVEFCKYKKIYTPASVIKLWDKEDDESNIIELEEAVNELRNKSDFKLNEISLPYSQYESLKSFENKYSTLKDENDGLRTKFQELETQNKELLSTQETLSKELTHLKENPIVKEKIVYKENTKELQDLNAECERLRLKLFNYETGRMSVPTHGINVGNVYKVMILGVGKDGDGFTRVNNFIIFVPETTKDQEVNIKITRVLKKYAFGKVLEGEVPDDVVDATKSAMAGDESDSDTQQEAPVKDPEINSTNA